jgi:hypothetical protein
VDCETFWATAYPNCAKPRFTRSGIGTNAVQVAAEIDAYEMDLVRDGKATCQLTLSANKLDYFDTEKVRIVLAATDMTATRLAEKQKDALIREKHVLLQEVQHRVANSLQIIASVLMQSAKRVKSEETRLHLHDAHRRHVDRDAPKATSRHRAQIGRTKDLFRGFVPKHFGVDDRRPSTAHARDERPCYGRKF